MTHVLIVPSWYPADERDIGGSFFREQALALQRHGLKVGVVAPRSLSMRKPSTWGEASKQVAFVDDQGVPTYRQTQVDWMSPLPLVGPRQWVARGLRMVEAYIAAHGRPDIVHAHSLLNAGLLAHRIAAKYGIPYVVTEHSTAFARGRVPRWKMPMATRAVSNASERIAVSEPFRLLMQSIFRSAGSWIAVPNIVDQSFLSGGLSKGSSTHGSTQFCNVGFMTAKKGQDVLIAAFARAFRGKDNIRLVIAGDGPLRPALEAQAQSLGVGGQVRFAGALSREQVRDLLAASDAFVLSSLVETFGVVVVEALAMGVPVVATRSGGPESIVGPQDGLLVPPGDEAALAMAMAVIAETRDTYRPDRIRERCIERFSGPAIADALSAVYSRALDADAAS
jgi:glycosyltransferase involved in cell wall biosynthesis